MIISRPALLKIRNISDKIVHKIKTHTLCSITGAFFSENFVLYKISWKNSESLAGHRWQYGICAFHAGYLRLQKHTLRKRNTYLVTTVTIIARKPLNVTLYVYRLSCYHMPTCSIRKAVWHRFRK